MGKCSKDKRDIFYRLAKEEGWRARSAFKLIQIHEQFGIFDGVTRAVDLCAAPGSWSQVLTRRLKAKESDRNNDKSKDDELGQPQQVKIVAVDIQTMAPIEGVTLIQGDITRFDTATKVIDEFQGGKAQLVVCDGAPDVTGQHDLDEFMQSQLLLAALNITSFIIEAGGTFVAKIFRGKDVSLMVAQFRIFFGSVQVIKPKSSRASSIEAFICCRNFQLPEGYAPRMFDLMTEFPTNPAVAPTNGGEAGNLNKVNEIDDYSRQIIPFVTCGNMASLWPGQLASSLHSSVSEFECYIGD